MIRPEDIHVGMRVTLLLLGPGGRPSGVITKVKRKDGVLFFKIRWHGDIYPNGWCREDRGTLALLEELPK